jgi:hypothetical protein
MSDIQDDDISNLILGASSKSAPTPTFNVNPSKETKNDFDVNKSYGTPSKLLDNLKVTESSGDPYALNKDTKAMGNYQFIPETTIDLHKKGVRFNPLDEKESRAAADWYISKLAEQNGGDYKKAMAQYGGFKTKDPTAYVNKVLNGVDFAKQAEPTTIATPQQEDDEIGSLILGSSGNVEAEKKQTFPKPKKEFPVNTVAPYDFAKPHAQDPNARAAAVIDTLNPLGVLPAISGTIGYGVGRIAGKSPQEASKFAEKATNELGFDVFQNMVGKATNQLESPDYEHSQLGDFVGKYWNKGADWIAQKTGAPKEDIENAIQATLLAYGGKSLVSGKPSAKPTTLADVGKPTPKTSETTILSTSETPNAGAKYEVPTYIRNQQGRATGAEVAQEVEANKVAQETKKVESEMHPITESAIAEGVNAGESVHQGAVNNHNKALSLDVPVELTEGQATQKPDLISDEKNARAASPRFVERFNQQNVALRKNIEKLKKDVAPDTNAIDYVDNAENAIGHVETEQIARKQKTNEAYKILEEANGGKFPVNSQLFAKNAIESLAKNEDYEFLPKIISDRLQDYVSGKRVMNFNQFDNLRTIISRSTREFQQANNGNAVHALSLVRQALEDLPMGEQTSNIKALADNARKLAKADFDLENTNKLYSDVVNKKSDSSNFIQNNILRGKNKDFENAIQLMSKNEDFMQHIKQGTMDYILRESTDASGNIKTAKFKNLIDNLDVNGRLDTLYGKETAQKLKNISEVGQLISAEPEGGYINKSNSMVVAKQLIKKGIQGSIIAKFPYGGQVAAEKLDEFVNSMFKESHANRALKPGAGSTIKTQAIEEPTSIDIYGDQNSVNK